MHPSVHFRMVRATMVALAIMLAQSLCSAQALRNWFDDPFFQVSAFIANCPEPAGPFISESERRVQSHSRAEKGASCWLAGECDRPNAYAYDQDIAVAFQQSVQDGRVFPGTTLWATVQGRVVYIEGCVTRSSTAAELERFARSLPNVQRAVAILRVGPGAPVPYKLRFPKP